MKISNGGIISKIEAPFQLGLGYILEVVGQLFEFKPSEKFHLESRSYFYPKDKCIKSCSILNGNYSFEWTESFDSVCFMKLKV